MPFATVSTAIRLSATVKSSTAPGTADSGSAIRGKYTFCTIAACATSEVLDFVTVELNAFHPSSPAYANTT